MVSMIEIINADVLDGLKQIHDKSIQCCVTSPPYWGLRDYGIEGQIGLEKTPEEYVAKLVEVFQEVKRVLRDDGTLWLNLGDSFASGKGTMYNPGGNEHALERKKKEAGVLPLNKGNVSDLRKSGLKPKDLVGIPWRVAFALQADGWYIRSDIIWSKPNPMPESVTDRPTKAHEYIFLLTKSARYFYDADAVREAAVRPGDIQTIGGKKARENEINEGDPRFRNGSEQWGRVIQTGLNGRNRRTVWEISTQPTPEAHFATFPEKLVEPCIKAGTSEPGCCSKCESPWVRVVEKEQTSELLVNGEFKKSKAGKKRANAPGSEILSETSAFKTGVWNKNITIGWKPQCTCEAEAIPCKVLDPFGGSGTVAKVARDLGRDAVMVEINPEYVKIMRRRLRLNEQLGDFQ